MVEVLDGIEVEQDFNLVEEGLELEVVLVVEMEEHGEEAVVVGIMAVMVDNMVVVEEDGSLEEMAVHMEVVVVEQRDMVVEVHMVVMVEVQVQMQKMVLIQWEMHLFLLNFVEEGMAEAF